MLLLIHQRRQARALKIDVTPAAAALARNMNPPVSLVDSPITLLSPWRHCPVTGNKHSSGLRQGSSIFFSGLTMFSFPSMVSADYNLVAYVDTGLKESRLHASLVFPSTSTGNQTRSYPPDTPSELAESLALWDALSTFWPLIATVRAHRVLFYTDLMQAVHSLRRFDRSFGMATDISVCERAPLPGRSLLDSPL